MMRFSHADIDALAEAALFFREECYDPLDVESDKLCKNIDDFVSKLRLGLLPGLTAGQIRNCCIFLENFIDNFHGKKDLTPHRALLVRLMEALMKG